MDANPYVSVTDATIPAVVSTAITVLYFLFNFINYLFNATAAETKTGENQIVTYLSEQEHSSTERAERGAQVHKTIPESLYTEPYDGNDKQEQYSRGTTLLSERRSTICLSTRRK